MTNPHSHLKVEVDYAGRTDCQPVYVGYAVPITGTGCDAWQIMRLDYDANGRLIQRVWADGNLFFDNVWDDRASLVYE